MSYKVLGQTTSGTGLTQLLYETPVGKETVVSTIVVTNTSKLSSNIRIAISDSSTLATGSFIVHDTLLPGSETLALTYGVTLEAGKGIYVFADNLSSASIAFNAFGSEL